ncbi:uncharacterized protein LOC110031650 isoform X2 [Phalaenopsis equestris]|uniref:uncharacterized protein LOC110031650 isoform X2 n=1 Tax=Phalaenopsis equestris TaxID=78828 RepID=UPI0009E276BB|nr:uncharacterized protein LOC110031650 isoform X2 [Phalaenopsis equestris]
MDGGDLHFDPPILLAGPYLGEISALSFLPLPSHLSSLPLLLAGTGSDLLFYNLVTGTLLRSFHVFDGVRVHGVSVRSYPDPLIAVFGEKKAKLFALLVDANPLEVRIELLSQLPRFEHWILDVKFLNDESYLALGFSDNSLAFWDVNNSTLAGRLKSPERCLLYSMRIWGEGLATLRLASGTIYNEVIVWRLSCENRHASILSLEPIKERTYHDEATKIGSQKFLPIHLCRLIGHEGSISRIAWSIDGSKLVSVSDDRSARIWLLNSIGVQYHGSEDNLRSHGTNTIVFFGHTARIWDCHISDSLVITAGEDCTCRMWDLDGNLLLMFKEHIGRGIWRCLFDHGSSLLVTAGFDSAIKMRQVHSPSVSEPTKDDRLLNNGNDVREIFTIAIPQVARQHGPMDSKSEYVRCLCFAQENALYVATNNGLLYHVEICNPGAVKWTQLAQVSKESPIVCMDLMPLRSCKSSSFMEYVIAVGDGMGKATVMKVIGGTSTSMVVFSLAWSAEKKRQLLGIYWCKSLGCRHLFTVDPRGMLKLWKINNALESDTDENNLQPQVSLIAEFTSYFGARIVCLDASARDEVLVCGDLRGNLTVYPLSEDIMNSVAIEMVKKVSLINRFKGAHGISTVTSIMITMLDFNQMEIRTTGGDGCICYFKYDKKLQVLEFIRMKEVKELSTVQTVYTSSIPSIESPMAEYAIGFTSVDFIMWNLANDTKMLEIPCGGWRRPYSFHLGAVPEYQFCFAYVKDFNIHIHRRWVPAHERQQHTQVLHLQYHGREIHTVCFISFPLQSNPVKPCDSMIVTGCEDGTVRLTRCKSLNSESWRESKLLGEHIGGSAVRYICFISKIYSIGADQTCCILNDVLDCSKTEPTLLISVGAKQVLTSWILCYQTADHTDEHLDVRELENTYCSSNCKHSSICFQWLATHSPSKYASPRRRLGKLPDATEHRNASDAKPVASIVENREQNSNYASMDMHENDWRYLAVTAFLVKHVDSRFTACFTVVACSDATLSLKALLLPYRLWFDVALLVPQPSPVLTLRHVAVPLCISASGNNSTHVAHIVISGSTDGSISFWDLTETVENFMQLLLDYQPKLFIDSQRRPRTGRGSQGGRWWRYLINQPSGNKMKDSMGKNKLRDGTSALSIENNTPESSCEQESHLVRDQIGSHHTRSSDSSSSLDARSMTSLARQELLPLFVLSSVHQSGVNCLHVSEMKDSNGKLGQVYCVVSGGDDQAVHYLSFQVDTPMINSASTCGQIIDFAKHTQNVNQYQPSGSSSVEKCSYNIMNDDHHIRILQRQSVNSAHCSSVKGIWTNGLWVFSTGLDQRIRCWQIGQGGMLIEHCHLIISVPEPESLDVLTIDRGRYQIAVAGRGLQIIDFFAPSSE